MATNSVLRRLGAAALAAFYLFVATGADLFHTCGRGGERHAGLIELRGAADTHESGPFCESGVPCAACQFLSGHNALIGSPSALNAGEAVGPPLLGERILPARDSLRFCFAVRAPPA